PTCRADWAKPWSASTWTRSPSLTALPSAAGNPHFRVVQANNQQPGLGAGPSGARVSEARVSEARVSEAQPQDRKHPHSRTPTRHVERVGARVLLLDGAGRVLMLRGHDPHQPQRSWWFTPGG